MSTGRTIVIDGDASQAMQMFDGIKQAGKDLFEEHAKAAEQYSDKLKDQADRVQFLIDREKELSRQLKEKRIEEARASRDSAMDNIKSTGGISEEEKLRRQKQANDEYRQSIKQATQDYREYNQTIAEETRLAKERYSAGERAQAGGAAWGGGRGFSQGAIAGGITGALTGGGLGGLAASVTGGLAGMIPVVGTGASILAGGITGALFSQGEKLAASRAQLMALTGWGSSQVRQRYTKQGKSREQRDFETWKEGGDIKLDDPRDSDLQYQAGLQNQDLVRRAEAETRALRENTSVSVADEKNRQESERKTDAQAFGYRMVNVKRAIVGTPSVAALGVDLASVAQRQQQLAMGAGTRQAAMRGEAAALLRLERGMGIGQGALQGWSDMRGMGLQDSTGDMMMQFLQLATKSKLWDVDKRDFSAIPREIQTLTAFMQNQAQTMVRPDAQQAMALRTQFAALDEDRVTGLFSGARGQTLMMGINQAIQSPANQFQSAMTLEAIMRANPSIGGGAVGLMRARAIQARGLFHGGGSTFQSMLDQIKEQTSDPDMRRVMLTTRFKQLLPFEMDEEGRAAMNKMFEADFGAIGDKGGVAEALKNIGFSQEMLDQFQIGTGTSQTEVLNTRVVNKLQSVGQSITESVSSNINKMIDFFSEGGLSAVITGAIDASEGDRETTKARLEPQEAKEK
jgi:hypothetical protein